MAESEAGFERVTKHTGPDGATAYLVEGGKSGEGQTSYWMAPQTYHELEKQGRRHLEEALARGVETSLQSDREARERR